MPPELIQVEQSVFAWAEGELLHAELDRHGQPGPTRRLLQGASRPGSLDGRVHVLVGSERVALDARGSVLERVPVVGAPIDAVLAWLAPEAAIVTSQGRPWLRRLDTDIAVPITPAFFHLEHAPLLRVLGRRVLWAQSGVHLGVIDFDRASRPQPLGGVDRLGCRRTPAALCLWTNATDQRAALLADDGRLEHFDLDTGRSVALGWLPTGACAATPELDRFVVVVDRAARLLRPAPTKVTFEPGPGATWLDAHALVILDAGQLVRVELDRDW